MKHDYVRVVLLDTNGQVTEKTIKDDLDTFHALIKCDTMQGLTYRKIGNVFVDLLIDDNGKMYGQDTITGVFINENYEVLDVILGNILFSWHDEDGDTIDVMPGTLENVLANVASGKSLTTPANSWKVAPLILVIRV